MKTLSHFIRTSFFIAAGLSAQAQAASDSKDINDYLVDISAGSVSAAGIVGAKSGITTIENSQDLVVALQPFSASGGQKSAFGLAITPAKTTLTPMAGSTYLSSPFSRLVGNLTFSYAQNQLDYGGKAYKAQGYAVNTLYYFNEKDDPVYAGSLAFQECSNRNKQNREAKEELLKKKPSLTRQAFEEALTRLTEEAQGPLFQCIDQTLKALSESRWNSARMSASYGQGRVGASEGGASYSLGRSMNLNAQLPAGTKGAVAISLRRATGGLDTDTLATASQTYKSGVTAILINRYDEAFRHADVRALGHDLALEESNYPSFSI